MREGFYEYQRRRLPHWRLKGSPYFVTWRVAKGSADLTPQERGLVVQAIKHFNGQRYALHSYVVMNDHVHVIVTPSGTHSLQSILQSWKSFTANQLQRRFGRIGSVWQEEYFDRIIRDEDEYWEKMSYVLNNSKKRWPEIQDYSWCGWFSNEDSFGLLQH